MPGNPALMRGDRRDFLRCGGNGFTMMRRWIAALLAACLLPALCSVALADGGFVITVPVVQGTLEEDIAVEIALSGCQDTHITAQARSAGRCTDYCTGFNKGL